MQFGKTYAKSKIRKHLRDDFQDVVFGPLTFVPDIDYESIESYHAEFTAVRKADGERVKGEAAHSQLIGVFSLSVKPVNALPEPPSVQASPVVVAAPKMPNRLNL